VKVKNCYIHDIEIEMRFLKDVNLKPIRRQPLRSFIQRERYHNESVEYSGVVLLPEARVLKKKGLFGRCNSLFHIDLDWIEAFYNAGLYSFLRTDAGGSNSPRNSKITCHRLSSYISWVLETHIDSNYSHYIPTNALLTVMELLVKNPQYVGGFMDFLTSQYASPSTKLTILCQLKKCATWSMLFCPVESKCDQHCFDRICQNIYRACSKQNRLRILRRGNLDILMKSKRWPEGGHFFK
jgi:hypothetical protein